VTLLWLLLGLGLLCVTPFLYLSWYLRWENRQTRGMAYYGRPLAARRALKRRMRLLSVPARPILSLLAAGNRARVAMPTFEYEGVSGPPKVSSPEVFARAARYAPRPEDVFVATQMRCGTTWMQQLVFQVVSRGRGDLTDGGFGHLYAASPWIDAVDSVGIDEAPLVGERPTRIIKTHLPASLCPYSPQAKYIYVTRHPVSCFASIADYNRSLLGPLAPPTDTLANWYCSDRMYWLPWPRHVEGWWEWANARENVLFVHFEEMTKDLAGVCDRVAAFLGCALTDNERRLVTERCSFQYMKDHEELFEMAPPTMFSVMGGEYMKSGRESRHEDVTPAIRKHILDYCRNTLKPGGYPAGRFYKDLAGIGTDLS
jgi:hypothetical protein